MASRQVRFAPRKVAVALIFSLCLHSALLLASLLSRQPDDGPQPPTVQCRVEDGPGLFLDLEYGSEKGGNEPQEMIAVKVEPLQSVSIDEGTGPLRAPPKGSVLPKSNGHPDSGGGAKGAALYGVPIRTQKVVFVLDRSLSMGLSGAFTKAHVELIRCLRALPEQTTVQVVLYNRSVETLKGSRLLPAAPALVAEVDDWMQATSPEGATDHVKALMTALGFEPETIFLITDADDLTPSQVRDLTRLNRSKAVLHTVDVSRRLRAESMLERLAQSNGGRHLRASSR